MLAVVWGHFLSPWGTVAIYAFHVPLFFFVSGFFLNRKKTLGTYAREKALQLFAPYVITSLVVLLGSVIKSYLAEGSAAGASATAGQWFFRMICGAGLVPEHPLLQADFIGPIWFLPALFFALVITRWALESRWGWALVLASVLLGYISSRYVWLPLSLQAGMMMAGYVYGGHLFRVVWDRVSEQYSEEPKMCILTVAGCLVASAAIWLFYLGGEREILFVCINAYPRGIVDYIGPAFGVVAVILFSHLALQRLPLVSDYLAWMGQGTLFLLCVHTVDDALNSWDWIIRRFDTYCFGEIFWIFVGKILIYSILLWIWKWAAKKIKP